METCHLHLVVVRRRLPSKRTTVRALFFQVKASGPSGHARTRLVIRATKTPAPGRGSPLPPRLTDGHRLYRATHKGLLAFVQLPVEADQHPLGRRQRFLIELGNLVAWLTTLSPFPIVHCSACSMLCSGACSLAMSGSGCYPSGTSSPISTAAPVSPSSQPSVGSHSSVPPGSSRKSSRRRSRQPSAMLAVACRRLSVQSVTV